MASVNNYNPSEWEDVTPSYNPTDWEDIDKPEQKPRLLSKMAQGAGQALKMYGDSQIGSPQDLLGRADSLVRSGANRGGEFVAEEAGRSGMNPKLAAGMGTFIQMTPDFLATTASPSSVVKGPDKLFRSTSRPLAQRSLGLTKRFLSTPFSRGRAAQAADVALDEAIIPFSGNPNVSMSRAIDLQERSGKALGAMRESGGPSRLDDIFESIESARQQATSGLRGGAWDTVHRKFDEAQETIMSLLAHGEQVPVAEIEKAKKLLSNSVNWMADNVSQDIAKRVSRAIEGGVETVLRKRGTDMAAYETQKSLFGASKTMQKGLANEVAAQAGNNAVSLPTMVAGAGQLATGNPMGALATVGAVEALRRRGAGFGSRVIDAAGGYIGRQLMTAREPLRAGMFSRSILKPMEDRSNPTLPSGDELKRLFNKPKERTSSIPRGGDHQMPQPYNNWNKQQDQHNDNRDLKSQQNHFSPQRVLTEEKAREYLKKSDGNKAMAREMAIADGWIIP